MEEMDKWNETTSIQVTEFILLGITDQPDLQIPLFLVFLIIYMVTALGNLGLIILSKTDSRLKTPMYFFLRNLAFIDLGYSTAIGPKMLVNFVVEKNTISYAACATQLVVFITLIISELFMLSVMAYDRYVAICNPLLYMVIMSDRMCCLLVSIPYLYSTFTALLTTIKIFNSSFWKSNVISHFYCDSLPLLSILGNEAKDVELIVLSLSAFNLVFSLMVVLVSYGLILMAVLRMNSAEGRRKAFSTCGSHLTVVVVFYGTLTFMYLQPKSSHSFDTDKMASVFYTLVIPMLNPLIYSLRNKEVKGALKRALEIQCKCLI
ncbi:olfactory receptor 8K3-like [Dromiciops gliroides]|uniref:olfactory receptor 8K3-like n=1 Tax=Dromiciops gliroides TaxID=33562 RepID=UPI001CC55BB8|nr:olfactory receptor 8K3-like [Dromiciops gliroides]